VTRIFISYRRDDSAGYAGRLFDRLSDRFGRDQIFMDIDTIEPGLDFVEVIEQAVGSCDVLIALLGRHWLSAADAPVSAGLTTPKILSGWKSRPPWSGTSGSFRFWSMGRLCPAPPTCRPTWPAWPGATPWNCATAAFTPTWTI
jgi:hypothetical protein